jgi:hypothetical protein
MKNPEQSRQFTWLMLISITVAAFLALTLVGLVYGCMRSNHAPQLKPVSAAIRSADCQDCHI